jgi:hypothetical protein
VRDGEIDEILKKAVQAPKELDPALLRRVGDSIKSSLRPVRPLSSTWVLTVGLVLVCAIVALAGAARAGFYGIEKMGPWMRGLVFSTLGILAWLAGTSFVNDMVPGSRRRFSSGTFLGISSVALLGVFALLFRDYRTEHFFTAGIVCLFTGLLHAIPAALLSWFVLRRGFAVNEISAGLIAGTLAGLAGVGVLELHCANFEAMHVLVWHTAVVPVSAAAGALLGLTLRFKRWSGSQRATSQ